MSAFFLSINRDASKFSAEVANNMMSAIASYGEDGSRLIVENDFALGFQSFWTVPEEQGEQQPLFDQASASWFVFYGRLDNRAELAESLGITLSDAISDAKLAHQFVLRNNASDLDKIIGPFSLLLYHPETSQVIAARDAMGGRNLVYKIDDSNLLIASHEMALVAHPSVDYQFNESRIGRMIAQIMPDTCESMIQGLSTLAPGDRIDADRATNSVQPFYRFDASARIRLKDDQAYAAEFRRLLSQAVARRARAIGPLGSMLSGGMDSVPVSILLAQQLAEKNETLIAFSWVYDRFPAADERAYSSPICDKFAIKQICINCDDVWPKLDQSTYQDPLLPFAIPYIGYQQALMASAQKEGVRSLITGIHGDLLYGHSNALFVELIAAGQWRKCFKEFKRLWAKPVNRSYIVKHMIAAQLPGMRQWMNARRNRQALSGECLTENINAQLNNQTPDLFELSLDSSRPESYRNVFSGFAGEDQALGRLMEANHSLERRYPFRDRDLCEFMLSIPSEQMSFNGMPRPIVKNAFRSDFTPELLARTDKTDFTAAIINGIQEDSNWRVWFDNPQAEWRHFVKQCYFDANSNQNTENRVVQWRCGYYDYWKSVCYNRVANELGLTDHVKNK